MKTSESIAKIVPALLSVQRKLTFAVKNGVNPHFKNRYADLASVIDAVKQPLNDAGILFLQTASPSDDGRLHLTTRLIHDESCEWIEDTAVSPLQKADAQGFGSAMTYLRRYSLASMLGLYQDDDDGQAASTEQKAEEALQETLKQIKEKKAIEDVKDICKKFREVFGNDQVRINKLTLAYKDKEKELGK